MFDERWEGGVVNPWVEAFREEYINYIKGKAKQFEKATFCARGCLDSVTRTREGRLIKHAWMCFIYINGVCDVDAALISMKRVRLYA